MTMPKLFTGAIVLMILLCVRVQAQRIDSIRFFTDDAVIQAELTTDLKALQSQKGTPVFQPATIKMVFPDSSAFTSNITVSPRGVNRRETCRIPPMMLNFRQDPNSPLASLGKLKLVLGCGSSSTDEELLLKEFVVYKIYNMLEDLSFRVRLMKVNYVDTRNRIRPFTQYSFVIEDDADLARRNNCRKKVHGSYLTEATDRNMMTMVAVFQYMIGNTDWAVPNNHNIKLLFRRDNDAALPYAIPYDFDYCGLVDASYAVPNEIIGTEKVTERVYRGFPRTIEELEIVLDVFRAKKESILGYVRNFTLLPEKTRRTMVSYLNEFYESIQSKGKVESIFIDNARKN
jgi:hypothetical protein